MQPSTPLGRKVCCPCATPTTRYGVAYPVNVSILYDYDLQGNLSHSLDTSGNIYGSSSGADAYGLSITSHAPTTFRLQGSGGNFMDPETGLTLFTSRLYDAQSGRFLTRDPLGQGGGADLYAYAGNDPANLSDPSGLCPTSERGLYRDAFNAFLQDPALAAGSRQRRDFSGFVQGAPGGFLLSGYAAATGYDPLAGAGLSGGERLLDAGLALAAAPGGDAQLDILRARLKTLSEGFPLLKGIGRATDEWHHVYPKYLGGAENQPLVLLPVGYHDAIHRALDQIFPRNLGANAYQNVDPADVWQALSQVYNQFPLDGFPWNK